MQNESGYESIYVSLKERLKTCDAADCAARLGLEISGENAAAVEFLGRRCEITRDGVTPCDGKPMGVNAKSCIAYYILSNGAGEPSGEYMPLFRLGGAIDGRNAQNSGLMTKPLTRRFGADPAGLEAAVKRLGGSAVPCANAYEHRFFVAPLPKIPMQIVLYEADDEFPAEINILLDKTAPRFMEFECLAFLCGCLVHALLDGA